MTGLSSFVVVLAVLAALAVAVLTLGLLGVILSLLAHSTPGLAREGNGPMACPDDPRSRAGAHQGPAGVAYRGAGSVAAVGLLP